MTYNFDEIIDRRNTNSENVEGWRPYIFHCGPERVFPYKDEEFIRMWVADMEFAVAPEILQAITDRVHRRILGYTLVYDKGYYEVLRAWCESRYGWSFPKEQLTFSPGVIPALYQLTEDLVKPLNGRVLTMTPAYGFFLHACEYNGVELVTSPLREEGGRFSIDWEDLEAKAADPDVKLLMLCNPHNPTGRIWTEEELRHMAAIIEKHRLWVVSDEIHCDLIRTGLRHTPLGKIMPDYDRLITCMSASKTFNLAGLVGSYHIIYNPYLRDRVRAKSSKPHYNDMNVLSMHALIGAYKPEGYEWVEELRETISGNVNFACDYITQHFEGVSVSKPEGTYMLFLDCTDWCKAHGKTIAEVEKAGWNVGVAWQDGRMFHGPCAIRMNLALPLTRVQEAFERLDKYVFNGEWV